MNPSPQRITPMFLTCFKRNPNTTTVCWKDKRSRDRWGDAERNFFRLSGRLQISPTETWMISQVSRNSPRQTMLDSTWIVVWDPSSVVLFIERNFPSGTVRTTSHTIVTHVLLRRQIFRMDTACLTLTSESMEVCNNQPRAAITRSS